MIQVQKAEKKEEKNKEEEEESGILALESDSEEEK